MSMNSIVFRTIAVALVLVLHNRTMVAQEQPVEELDVPLGELDVEALRDLEEIEQLIPEDTGVGAGVTPLSGGELTNPIESNAGLSPLRDSSEARMPDSDDGRAELEQLGEDHRERADALLASLDASVAQNCRNATENYLQSKSACGSVCTGAMLNRVLKNKLHRHHGKAKAFDLAQETLDAQCMSADVAELEDWAQSFSFDEIQRRTGVLVIKESSDDQGKLVCGAGLLDEDTLITARHCIFKSLNREHSEISRALRNENLYFLSLSAPNVAFLVGSFEDTSGGVGTANDYIGLKLKNKLDNVTQTRVKHVSKLDSVLIAGWFSAAKEKFAPNDDWPKWRKMVRWYRPQCFVLDKSSQCLIHTCGTEKGFSGAPIWAVDSNGNTHLAGLQSGYSSAVRGCGFSSMAENSDRFNIGSTGFIPEGGE